MWKANRKGCCGPLHDKGTKMYIEGSTPCLEIKPYCILLIKILKGGLGEKQVKTYCHLHFTLGNIAICLWTYLQAVAMADYAIRIRMTHT